ncbi:MAG: galactokinase [Clostridia bacterium]|nr:galactokinase [Clostridia bacterium]
MLTNELVKKINEGILDEKFAELYDKDAILSQRERYLRAIDSFCAIYGEGRDIAIYSVAGRSELAGNHTDHNHGCVVAASINLDIIAIVSKNDKGIIDLKSDGFPRIIVDYSEYAAPVEEKFGTSDSLIAGMCAGFLKNGYKIGGFDAYCTSSVLKGSGLSSSAAFEDMIGNILSHEYNEGGVDNVEISKLSQYAENVFFGKPCGLMDQVACAVGGIVAIDFEDTAEPKIEKIDFDLTGAGYNLCIVDTGGNHADLTADYASVPAEMKAVAAYFGKPYLRLCDEDEVKSKIAELRTKVGDRALLRALHFFEENKRVAKMKSALLNNDISSYFDGVLSSGRSSFCYLQNVYTTKNVEEQGLSLALCVTESYLKDKNGAFRVHGGGFAGTIQAYVRTEDVEGYRAAMDGVFGKGACLVLRVRKYGALRVI